MGDTYYIKKIECAFCKKFNNFVDKKVAFMEMGLPYSQEFGSEFECINCKRTNKLRMDFVAIKPMIKNDEVTAGLKTKKDFDGWNNEKIKIDKNKTFNHPKEKEIWWCSIGVNIGSEVFGKSRGYTRPVLVINAEGSESFIGIPLTSNIKNKKYSCTIKTDDGMLHTALVYQIRSYDKRRLTDKKYLLSDEEYLKISGYFKKLYKI